MNRKISAILILIAGIFWGSSCLFIDKLTSMGFSEMQCAYIRMTLAAPLLHVFLLCVDGKDAYKRIKPLGYLMCALSGCISVPAMCILYFYSMTMTSAAVSAILLYTAPIFVMIMSVIFFKEKITAQKVISFVIAICGCALVSGIAGGVSVSALGILFGVIAGFSYSLYGIIATFAMRWGCTATAFAAFSFTGAALVMQILVNPIELFSTAFSDGVGLKPLLFVFYSICTAVVPFALYTIGLAGVKPVVASVLAFAEPLTAAVFGIFILGQGSDLFSIIGIFLIVVAIVILNITPKKKLKY